LGIDPGQADHVVDAVDQQIEQVVARVEESISAAEAVWGQMQEAERAVTLKALEGATEDIEHAVQRLDPVPADAAKNGFEGDRPKSDLLLDELSRATGRIGQVVERVEAAIEAPAVSQKESREDNCASVDLEAHDKRSPPN
jgi:hypothetical protein